MTGSAAVQEFSFQQPLGGQLAWCTSSNLLAAELQAGGETNNIPLAILDPSCPEDHFIVHVPQDGAPGDKLAWLEWSPPGYLRALLTVLASGTAYVWTQESPNSSDLTACTISEWFGQKAFSCSSAPVAVQWLEPLTPWAWPPRPAQHSAQSIESTFRAEQAAGRPSGLHWVRPAVLCCAAVTKEGSLEVFWCPLSSVNKASPWQSAQAIALPVQGPMTAATVTTAVDGCLRVAAVAEGDPQLFTITEVRGDPTCVSASGKPPWPVECSLLATVQAGGPPGALRCQCRFVPGSAGTQLLTLTQPSTVSDAATLALHAQQDSPSNWQASHANEVPSPRAAAAHTDSEPNLCLACSADGAAAIVACSGGSTASISVVGATSHQVLQHEELAGHAVGLAWSPNSAMLAVACHSSLRIIQLKPESAGAAMHAGADVDSRDSQTQHWGNRLLWSLLTGTHAWDLTHALRAAEPAVLRAALDWVDGAVHAQPHNSRPWYCQMWDRLKLLLLVGLEDPHAQAIVLDLAARGHLARVAAGLDQLVPMDHLVAMQAKFKGQPSSVKPLSLAPADDIAVDAWLDWVERYTLFTLCCIKLWVRQHSVAAAATADATPQTGSTEEPASTAASNGGQEALPEPTLDALPCIRLLADYSFTRQLMLPLTINSWLTHTRGGEAARTRLDRPKGAMDAYRAVIKAVQADLEERGELPAALTEAEREVPGTNLAVFAAARSSFQGEHHLHYARTHGPVRWQALQEIVQQPRFAALPGNIEPTPSLLYKMAQDLGLVLEPPGPSLASPVLTLHARSADPPGLPTPMVTLSALRQQVEENTTPAASTAADAAADMEGKPAIKSEGGQSAATAHQAQQQRPQHAGQAQQQQRRRKRWQAERDTALGVGRAALRRGVAMDVIGGSPISWQHPDALISTDGLCITAELSRGPQLGADTLSINAQHIKPAWRHACPLTGNLWKRVAC